MKNKNLVVGIIFLVLGLMFMTQVVNAQTPSPISSKKDSIEFRVDSSPSPLIYAPTDTVITYGVLSYYDFTKTYRKQYVKVVELSWRYECGDVAYTDTQIYFKNKRIFAWKIVSFVKRQVRKA